MRYWSTLFGAPPVAFEGPVLVRRWDDAMRDEVPSVAVTTLNGSWERREIQDKRLTFESSYDSERQSDKRMRTSPHLVFRSPTVGMVQTGLAAVVSWRRFPRPSHTMDCYFLGKSAKSHEAKRMHIGTHSRLAGEAATKR